MPAEMTTAQLIVDILKTSVPLEADQIWVYNQQTEIPVTKNRVFVSVGYVSMKPYGSNRKETTDVTGMGESCSVVLQEVLSINVFSGDYSAVQQLPFILSALSSTYAQEMQAKWSFQLGRVPVSVVETSEIEGSAIQYRFTVTINCLRGYTKEGNIPYYDTFSTDTHTEKGTV